MSEDSSRQSLIALVPRQVMLETATKAAATTKYDNYKKKMKDKRVAVVGVEDEGKKSKKKNSYKISDLSEEVSGAEVSLAQHLPIDDGVSRNGLRREDLLRSIAAFLEQSGFSKTLSVFLLEAKVNNRGGSCINLENVFYKVIESSQTDPIPCIEWSKEQGILTVNAADDSNAEAKDKKRKDKLAVDSVEEENAVKHYLDDSIGAPEKFDYENSPNIKKKKRRKVTLSENKVEEVCLNFEEVKELKELTRNDRSEMDESLKNKSEKKKKKKEANKSFKQFESGANQEVVLDKTNDGGDYVSTRYQKSAILSENNKREEGCLYFEEVVKEKTKVLKDPSGHPSFEMSEVENDKGEKKKKKKKNDNQSLERFDSGINLEEVNLEKSSVGGGFPDAKHHESLSSEKVVKDLGENVEVSKKNKKKDKTKNLEESTSDSLPRTNSDKLVKSMLDGLRKNDDDVLNNSDVERFTNNKRKRSSSKETSILVENIISASKSKLTKSDVPNEKKRTDYQKVFACSDNAPLIVESKESSEALSNIILDNHAENFSSTLKQLNGHQPSNGNDKKHQKDESIRPNTMKKEKRSGEPKEINSFQRIKVDDVQFADERLQDNSYWALDDSGSGYGAKAQEVLGQVKGRDFRHEKTKKKRGTYRGGQIDLQAHSVKFNYSDED